MKYFEPTISLRLVFRCVLFFGCFYSGRFFLTGGSGFVQASGLSCLFLFWVFSDRFSKLCSGRPYFFGRFPSVVVRRRPFGLSPRFFPASLILFSLVNLLVGRSSRPFWCTDLSVVMIVFCLFPSPYSIVPFRVNGAF